MTIKVKKHDEALSLEDDNSLSDSIQFIALHFGNNEAGVGLSLFATVLSPRVKVVTTAALPSRTFLKCFFIDSLFCSIRCSVLLKNIFVDYKTILNKFIDVNFKLDLHFSN